MKIATIIGARPQFIKAAVVSRAFKDYNQIKEVIIHTGQHFDKNMSEVFFEEMNIPKPDYNLGINGLTHGAMTGRMLENVESVLIKEKPDCVLVYGDTDSTLAGAIAACKLHIKLAHVEAGLRSYNMSMPEEINRILTDRVSNILFCPTVQAIDNLKKEGFENMPCKIVQSGDVMFDAAKYYSGKMVKPKENIPDDFILCTIHRAENTESAEKLFEIFKALERISANISVVVPLHPRTKNVLVKNGYNFSKSNIRFIEPVGYFEMLYLITHSLLIVTDSGGLQKEAYFFAKKCVTIREQTEWVELTECGCNVLAETTEEDIVKNVNKMIDRISDFSCNLYGEGNAGEIIVKELFK